MNCDAIAPWYRWLEYLAFGPALHRRRLEYVDDTANAKRVLIFGDGDGRFTAEFLKRNGAATVDSIDVSAGMMRLAERRIRRVNLEPGRVRLFVADAMTTELRGSYDLVISHYFLDCFTTNEIEKLISRVRDVVSPGARWLVSEFRAPEAGVRRLAAVLLIKALYLSFRILTGLKAHWLPDYAAALKSGGFRRLRQRTALGGLLVSELWQR